MINRKSRVLHPGPVFLSSVTQFLIPKKHSNGLVRMKLNARIDFDRKDIVFTKLCYKTTTCEQSLRRFYFGTAYILTWQHV